MDVTVGPSLLCLPAPREDGKLGSHPIRERWIREGEHPKPPRTAASQPASSVLEAMSRPCPGMVCARWPAPGGQAHGREGSSAQGRGRHQCLALWRPSHAATWLSPQRSHYRPSHTSLGGTICVY